MDVLKSEDSKGELGELAETRKAVENAESRARLEQRKRESKVSRRNQREFAQALHREADQLYHKGDYETALVLYHRAANVFPRDSSHTVAARRTAATISSWNKPSRALRKLLPNVKNEERLSVTLCPESAALKANGILKKSPNPASVTEILSYFDNHKSFWKQLPSPKSSTHLTRPKAMLRHLTNLANQSLKNLQATFASGKITASLNIAQELLTLSSGLPDPTHYQIPAYHYLSLIQVSLGRHDRAITHVSSLIRLSKNTGDVVQICRSFVTLGKVHLSFGHFEAAAKAWENLSTNLNDPVPLAWIHHEIGRCYLETGKYKKALKMASICVESAVEGNSNKWLMHGKLLLGQSLAKLGRLAEAREELMISAQITEVEGDTPMLSYIHDLIDRVTCTLRLITSEKNGYSEHTKRTSSLREKRDFAKKSTMFTSTEDTVTTVFSERTTRECENGSSSSEETADPNEEMTHSGKRSLMQSYRGMEVRDLREVRDEEVAFLGSSTFRVQNSRESEEGGENSLYSFTSCTSDVGGMRVEDGVNNLEESDGQVSRVIDAGFGEGLNGVGSRTSLGSDDTNVTYVIGLREMNDLKELRENRGRVEDSEKEELMRGVVERVDRSDGKSGWLRDGEKGAILEDKDDVLNAFGINAFRKDKGELLEMLRDMLLTEDEDRSGGLVNCEDSFVNRGVVKDGDGEFRTSRSYEDGRNMIVRNQSLYRHSLPSSPRDDDVDGISCGEGRIDG